MSNPNKDIPVPDDLRVLINAATCAIYPGVCIDWSDQDPALVVPVQLRPQVKDIITFITEYSIKLGVYLEFPPLDTQESSITYPTR